MIEKVGDNAYKLDLPGEYKVHATFNVCDLSPFDVSDERLMEQPFQEEGDGVNTIAHKEPTKFPVGPITRARAKRYQININAYCQTWINSCDNFDDNALDLCRKDLCVLQCIGIEDMSGKALLEEDWELEEEESKESVDGTHQERDRRASTGRGPASVLAGVARSSANRGRTAKEERRNWSSPRLSRGPASGPR